MAENNLRSALRGRQTALVVGVSIADAAREHGIATRTIDRWLEHGRLLNRAFSYHGYGHGYGFSRRPFGERSAVILPGLESAS